MGLGGASVGAGAALLGGWLQQRSQAKSSREVRHEERHQALGQTALTELLGLQQRLRVSPGDFDHADQTWIADTVEHLQSARMAMLLVPNAPETRRRMEEIFQLASRMSVAGAPLMRRLFVMEMTTEGIEVLAAFMRGDPLPPPSELFVGRQLMVAEHDARRTGT